jgi:hypothetical protein
MPEIPARRRMLESLLVQAMLEADDGFQAAAADYATAVLLMLDAVCDPELEEVAAGILRGAGVVDESTARFE